MSLEQSDFRPVGPGFRIVIEYQDGHLEDSALAGWTWTHDTWCPTYWNGQGLTAVWAKDPQLEIATMDIVERPF